MKIIKTTLQYILTFILSLEILAVILINIFSSSILNQNYIISKLEEEDYYSKIYEIAKSKFENYIYQSGLEEEVLNDIITKEKVEQDTKKIINNIFNGLEEEVDTEEIATKLNENINTSIGRTPTATEKKSIDKFVDIICKEYKTAILSTNYEQKINSVLKKATKNIDMVKKALLILIGVTILIIALLTIKRIYRLTARIGVALTVDGSLLLIAINYINAKVKIQGISILNDAISLVIRNILSDILSRITQYGIILLSVGIIFILIYGIIKAIRKANRQKERYNPEK